MKIVIVNAFGHSNKGDSVLLDECISDIKEYFGVVDISVAVFEDSGCSSIEGDNISWTERIGNSSRFGLVAKLQTIFYMFVCWLGVVSGASIFFKFLPAGQRETIYKIMRSDLVVSAPGGYIHDTNYAFVVALFHVHVACLLGKSVVLAAQSIGPIRSRFFRWITSRVLRRVSIICSREDYSYKFLTSDLNIAPSKIVKSGDMAFWNNVEELNDDLINTEIAALGVPVDAAIFGLTVVDWNFPGLSGPDNLLGRYLSEVARVIDHICIEYKLTPVIFNQVSSDISAGLRVKELAKVNVFVDERSREPKLLRALIRRSQIFLGTRFHSCIFAMMAARPLFAISYLPKTEFILRDLNLEDRFESIENFSAERAISVLSADMVDLSGSSEIIEGKVSLYRNNHLRLVDAINISEDLKFVRIQPPGIDNIVKPVKSG